MKAFYHFLVHHSDGIGLNNDDLLVRELGMELGSTRSGVPPFLNLTETVPGSITERPLLISNLVMGNH